MEPNEELHWSVQMQLTRHSPNFVLQVRSVALDSDVDCLEVQVGYNQITVLRSKTCGRISRFIAAEIVWI